MLEMRRREFKVHNNFAEADEADYEYYRSLTGNEKLKLMLEIMAPYYKRTRDLKEFFGSLSAPRVDAAVSWRFRFAE